ncbi:MAG: hypothetical protein ACI9B7_000197 [Oleispira sp.]|jgi:hypothetical protein
MLKEKDLVKGNEAEEFIKKTVLKILLAAAVIVIGLGVVLALYV